MDATKPSSVSGQSTEQTTLPATPEDTMPPTTTDAEKADEKDEKDATDEPTSGPEPEPEYPGPVRLALIMMSLLLAMFLISLDQTIIATAIPKITDEFQGLEKVAWYGAAYFLTFASFLASWGKSLQFTSIKWAFLSAFFLFEIGSLVCAVAPNANALIVGRAIAGVGCSGVATIAFVTVALASPPERRPILLGLLATTYGISAVVGPLLGGAFTGSSAGWRWCFWINLPVGGVAAVATLFSFRLPQPKQTMTLVEKIQTLDIPGIVLVLASLIMFILALQDAGQAYPWRSAHTIGLLVGSAAVGAVWVAWQAYQGDRAMVVLRVLLGTRGVWSGAAFQFFFASSYFVGLYYLPIYFQSIQNRSPIGSGVHNLPLVISITLAGLISGAMLSRFGRAGPVMFAASALATVACGLFYTLDEHTSAGRWIGFQILAGVCWGAAFQYSLVTAQTGLPVDDVPMSSTIIFFCQTIGNTLAITAVQCAFNNTLLLSVRRNSSLDPFLVLTTGVTEIRTVFSGSDLAVVLHAYIEALRVVWAISIAFGGLSFVASLACRWERLFTKDEGAPAVGV